MFEKASRLALRFESTRGKLSVEQLWDLPMTELNELYKGLNKVKSSANEDSLLDEKTSEEKLVDLKLSLIRHVAEVRKKEAKDKKDEAQLRADLKTIDDAIAEAEDRNLKSLTPEELRRKREEILGKIPSA